MRLSSLIIPLLSGVYASQDSSIHPIHRSPHHHHCPKDVNISLRVSFNQVNSLHISSSFSKRQIPNPIISTETSLTNNDGQDTATNSVQTDTDTTEPTETQTTGDITTELPSPTQTQTTGDITTELPSPTISTDTVYLTNSSTSSTPTQIVLPSLTLSTRNSTFTRTTTKSNRTTTKHLSAARGVITSTTVGVVVVVPTSAKGSNMFNSSAHQLSNFPFISTGILSVIMFFSFFLNL